MKKPLLGVLCSLATLSYLFVSSVLPVLAANTYSYDTNGNMTSDGQYCYTFNDANQLSLVKDCGSGQLIAQYVYDYQGNRIAKKEYTGGNLSKTIYSPQDEYETVKPATGSAQNTSYYFANNQLLAKKNPDGSKTYYQNDHLGSASLLTDQNGSVVENTTYFPFGGIRSGGTTSKYLFTGQEKDTETNLDYFNSRYYNSSKFHFTQPDTVIPDVYNPQTLNRYAYVNNNPIKYTDPTGHIFGIDDAALGLYVILLTSSPDLATDTNFLAQSITEFQEAPGIATGIGVAMNLASMAIPEASFGGPNGKAVGKVGEEAVGKIGEISQTVKNVIKTDPKSNNAVSRLLESAMKGQQMHRLYKANETMGWMIKEFKDISGLRTDFIDFSKQIIDELKPDNPRAISRGFKQLDRYKEAFNKAFPNLNFVTTLHVYDKFGTIREVTR